MADCLAYAIKNGNGKAFDKEAIFAVFICDYGCHWWFDYVGFDEAIEILRVYFDKMIEKIMAYMKANEAR